MKLNKITLITLACLFNSLLSTITIATELPSTPAPNFTLKSDSGKNIKLSELRGQVILLNFWASWCGPCRQEMPLLEKLYTRYQPLGFTLLGINAEEDSTEAKQWLKGVTTTFPILFDDQTTVSELYDVSAMPTTIIIDRDGNMRYLHKGYTAGVEEEYQAQVRALLKE